MPRGGFRTGRPGEGFLMASSPVATAAQAVEQDAVAQPAAQTAGAGAKLAQSTAVQDTVTLSNGVPQQTPAEEAGLFQVSAPTFNSAPARDALNTTSGNAGIVAAPRSGPSRTASCSRGRGRGSLLPPPLRRPIPLLLPPGRRPPPHLQVRARRCSINLRSTCNSLGFRLRL